MPRSSSISSIPSTAPGHPTSGPLASRSHPASPPSATATTTKPRLAKASSLADLRLAKHKLFARFRGTHTANGDDDELWGTTEEEAERAPEPPVALPSLAASSLSTRTRTPTPRAPRRPAAPCAFPLDAALSAEEIRRLERQREAELAAAAALDYTLSSSHARRSSRSSTAAAQADQATLTPHSLAHAIERLNMGPSTAYRHAHKRSLSRDVLEPGFAFELRGRSGSVASLLDSTASSECSSRPRTNDSLPSFAESASTVDTSGSFPPSPMQSPTLRSRPTFGTSYKEVKVDTDSIAAQPRAYAFI
ncbi:hypothetical protein JCM3775_001222 [Rhodotorula graminis]|uniref:Uncharacterized protein n=1 Tax=Rhodotorula graminis (strain WP1) TaxID=578459 RepID=A0A194S4N5_RHOGW|nr:uncharacterized protein RHOBADRAFT_53447 [Rhodotorula graminis WP1]KPV75475.1 hypothetical protein RHOBADRAFT_53447 [Rhodotorula graminis WP1]